MFDASFSAGMIRSHDKDLDSSREAVSYQPSVVYATVESKKLFTKFMPFHQRFAPTVLLVRCRGDLDGAGVHRLERY